MYLEMLRKLNIDFTMNKNKLYNIFFTFIYINLYTLIINLCLF